MVDHHQWPARRLPQGVLGHLQCEGFRSGGLFRGAVAAWLGGATHAVARRRDRRGDGPRDRRGRCQWRRRGYNLVVYELN